MSRDHTQPPQVINPSRFLPGPGVSPGWDGEAAHSPCARWREDLWSPLTPRSCWLSGDQHSSPPDPKPLSSIYPSPRTTGCSTATSLCSKRVFSKHAGCSHSHSPTISSCSMFPSTLSHPILSYSSNRALALSPGKPRCSHRSCCLKDRILLISSPHFPPVKLTVGLSAVLPQAVTSPLLPCFFKHLSLCSDLSAQLLFPLVALLPFRLVSLSSLCLALHKRWDLSGAVQRIPTNAFQIHARVSLPQL